jgi:hypothetical protein
MDDLMGILYIIAAVLILRAIGAWMLRINEIISIQEKILEELKKMNGTTIP